MATTLTELSTLAEDPAFVKRMKAAAVYQAVRIIQYTDNMPDPTIIDKFRRILAIKVLQNRDKYANDFAWILASLPSVTANSTDGELVSMVNSAWTHLMDLYY